MLVSMRTSMNLPDSLLEDAKARAAAEGSTVTQLVVEGLRTRLSVPSTIERETVSPPRRRLGRAGIDISDNEATRELLDADDDSKYRDPR
jgi:hypothetical protein